jgi:NAD+ synthetase
MYIAIAQTNPKVGAVKDNADHALALLEELAASAYPPDLVIFPAYALTGNPVDGLRFSTAFAAELIEGAAHFIHHNQLQLLIGAMIPRPQPETFSFINEPEVLYCKDGGSASLGFVDLNNEWDPEDYASSVTTVIDGHKLTVLLDEFPDRDEDFTESELVIMMMAKEYNGNNDMFTSSAQLGYLRGFARENKTWVVVANLCGAQDDVVFDGASVVIRPDGRVAANAEPFVDGLLSFNINFDDPLAPVGLHNHRGHAWPFEPGGAAGAAGGASAAAATSATSVTSAAGAAGAVGDVEADGADGEPDEDGSRGAGVPGADGEPDEDGSRGAGGEDKDDAGQHSKGQHSQSHGGGQHSQDKGNKHSRGKHSEHNQNDKDSDDDGPGLTPFQDEVIVKPLLPYEADWKAIVISIRDYMHKNGFSDALLGLSGGIDSAVTATLAVDALGAEHVHGLLMPGPHSSKGSIKDAEELAANLGIQTLTIAIDKPLQAFTSLYDKLPDIGPAPGAELARQNIQARIRTIHLMHLSNSQGWLLLNTGNKSEAAMGYSTLYGDTAGALAPLGNVYKSDVYGLARWRNERKAVIPQSSIDKQPSAELYDGQLDSDALPPYPLLDNVLRLHIEEGMGVDQILEYLSRTPESGEIDAELVENILDKVRAAEYKRRQEPLAPSLGYVDIGNDRGWPITNGFVDKHRMTSPDISQEEFLEMIGSWDRPQDWGYLAN